MDRLKETLGERAFQLVSPQKRFKQVELKTITALAELPAVAANLQRLVQVIVNLLLNAADAMEGGSVVIADYDDHSVIVVERDYTVQWKVRQIDRPCEVVGLPDGSVLVASANKGMVLHLRGREILSRWPVAQYLEDISFAPNGNLLLAIRPTQLGRQNVVSSGVAEIPQAYRRAREPRRDHLLQGGTYRLALLIGVVLLFGIVFTVLEISSRWKRSARAWTWRKVRTPA